MIEVFLIIFYIICIISGIVIGYIYHKTHEYMRDVLSSSKSIREDYEAIFSMMKELK